MIHLRMPWITQVRSLVVGAVVAAVLTAHARGETVEAEWIGAAAGSWNSSGSWGVVGQAGPFDFIPNNTVETQYLAFLDRDELQATVLSLDVNATIDGLTIGGNDQLRIVPNRTLAIRGSTDADNPALINNGGEIFFARNAMGSDPDNTLMIDGGSARLSGGRVQMTHGLFRSARIAGQGESPRLVIAQESEIVGVGKIGEGTLRIENHGTIVAQHPTPTSDFLTIKPNAAGFLNTGNLLATGVRGHMELLDGVFNQVNPQQGDNGLIHAASGGDIHVVDATILGGTILISYDSDDVSSGSLALRHATIGGNRTIRTTIGIEQTGSVEVQFANQPTVIGANLLTERLASITLKPAARLKLMGGYTTVNEGHISVEAEARAGATTDLIISDRNLFLRGGGTISLGGLLNEAGTSRIIADLPERTLVNRGNTILGNGEIGGNTLAMRNGVAGTIRANRSQPLVIDPVNSIVFVNDGTMSADSGTLRLTDGTYTNTGTIEAVGGGMVEFTNSATLTNNQNGDLVGGKWIVVGSETVSTMTLPGQRIHSSHAKIVMSGSKARFPSLADTIRNFGSFQVVDGQSFRPMGDFITDEGPGPGSSGTGASAPGMQSRLVESDNGDPSPMEPTELIAGGRFIQHSGTSFVFNATIGGEQGVVIESGLLEGDGRVFGGTSIEPPALLSPGLIKADPSLGDLSVGTLEIGGRLEHHGMLRIEIAGETPGVDHDQLNVSDEALLGGQLNVRLKYGFIPLPDQQFTILTGAAVIGEFDNATETLTLRQGTFHVSYRPQAVVLDQFQPVPEPTSYALLLVIALVILIAHPRPMRVDE